MLSHKFLCLVALVLPIISAEATVSPFLLPDHTTTGIPTSTTDISSSITTTATDGGSTSTAITSETVEPESTKTHTGTKTETEKHHSTTTSTTIPTQATNGTSAPFIANEAGSSVGASAKIVSVALIGALGIFVFA